jgi:hypothetical protein
VYEWFFLFYNRGIVLYSIPDNKKVLHVSNELQDFLEMKTMVIDAFKINLFTSRETSENK